MAAVLNTEDDKNIVENSVLSSMTVVQGEQLHASMSHPETTKISRTKQRETPS